MKFCKNLQRVVDISDPEWAPYWTNYKMLKVSWYQVTTNNLHHTGNSSPVAVIDGSAVTQALPLIRRIPFESLLCPFFRPKYFFVIV
jgi:hypothetical protein